MIAQQKYFHYDLDESNKKNKNKFKDYENYKKKPQIDKLNLML